jgi:hypothetical protein
MGTFVEKVVTEVLSDKAERRALLSDIQFGSRKKWSAINAAAMISDRSHTMWKEDNITGILRWTSLAVSPSVTSGSLIHAINVEKIDGDVIRWTESVHGERTVEMVIEGNVLPSHPMDAGVQQGSRVSLIPSAIHTTGLIMLVDSTLQAKGLSFVDDLGLVATVKNVNQVVDRLEACEAVTIQWAS